MVRSLLPISESDQRRFWSKVKVDPGGCWLWMASKNSNGTGYGTFRMHGSTRLAHRVAVAIVSGAEPGPCLDHLCKNSLCVRPAHLEAVTQRINVRRGSVGALNRSKTHCPHGHEYNPQNTFFAAKAKRPGRRCRTCSNIRRQKYR